jgi:hypothetical protein
MEIEAEAKARGISAPELCRIIIIERCQRIKEERWRVAQMAPSPKPLTVVSPSGSPGTGTPRPVTVPVAPVMTESMKRAGVVLAKIAERNPEFFDNMVWDQINKGKMSLEEAAKLLERLGSRA